MVDGSQLSARGVARVRAGGEANLSFLEFPAQRAEDGFGTDRHPSVATHRRMAYEPMRTLLRHGFGH